MLVASGMGTKNDYYYIYFFSTAGQTGVLVYPRTIVIVHYLRTVDFFSLFVTPQIENGSNLIELEI